MTADSRSLLLAPIRHFAAALELWTAACLSRGELIDANEFIDAQWSQFAESIQQLRIAVANSPPVVHEQLAMLPRLAAELREAFQLLARHIDAEPREIELAILKLESLWRELRDRVTIISNAVHPGQAPVELTTEQESYFQGILDGLFDRFTAHR